MKELIRNPAVNAGCIGLFTAFYSLVFFVTAGNVEFSRTLYYSAVSKQAVPFWSEWSAFLAAGRHMGIAYAMIGLTVLVILLLISHRKKYDEYHAAVLARCFTVALALTLIAIAVFYLMILSDANGIVEKFTLFVSIHWSTVVMADLAYVLWSR
ncbi:hypothetical protein [Papillibacter cinnamivorans]|uniref:Uncharacterized protein n=1 Tax=Papillibacter cinnamivorans DSM 12816 TaxID=1122930 RepID=A0A1W2AGJ8_9FIRM|nr:hypothetical protein [Papillibacter cinnamivorans]SMC59754.1 hypothetical protein SAMN02745168_1703 [Papillibacter cinnamivorans DSM 12816]